MKAPVTEWRIVIHHGFSRTRSTYTMGVDAKGEARACDAASDWRSVARHADDTVKIESREVHSWTTDTNQVSLNI